MKEDGGVVAILLDNVEDMFKHLSANSQPTVGRQAPKCHYVKLEQNW